MRSELAVRVPVATLFSEPAAVRGVDGPAVGPAPDAAAWVAGLSPEQRMGEGVLSQLLLGERVLVEQVAGGWARVVAVDQPAASLDPRGYPGWLPYHQLAAVELARPDWVVDVTATTLVDRPGGAPVLSAVVFGTRFASTGPPHDGWLPVRVPGATGWLPESDLAPLPDPAAGVRPAASGVLAVAERLTGTPYVWGGVSPCGIDCSGLVRLAWWRLGATLPRDAADQAAALPPVPLGEERPGDLYVFARPGAEIHHIGLVAAAPDGEVRRMLHASSTRRRVLSEAMPPDAAATLVGAHRL